MQKQFVTYEISLKLKDLSFDEKCLGCYVNNELEIHKPEYLTSQKKHNTFINLIILYLLLFGSKQ